VQSEIAIAIAEALSAKVTGEEKKSLARAPTSNLAAYEAYLRGLAVFRTTNPVLRQQKVAKFMEEAVRLDPNFALAWALLAKNEANSYFNLEKTDAQRRAARAAADTALRLQPDLPEVQLAQGFYQYYVERLLKLAGDFPLTPALLRLDPAFDKVRGDARFEALAKGSQP
jgi:hypothetical protein